MRIISAPSLTALDGPHGRRCLVRFAPYNVDPVCYWDDLGTLSYGGDTYQGAVGRFTVKLPESASDLSVRGAQVTFSGLDTAAIALIEGAVWSQRPAKIMRAIFAIDTPQTLVVHTEFSGFMDRMEWTEAAAGDPSALVVYLESTAREFELSGARTASDADQRDRDSDDGIFSFAASAVTQNIDWGKTTETITQTASTNFVKSLWDHVF